MNKKIFITLFFAIFAAVTGMGIVVPLLPVYADKLGASGLFIGFIFGAFSLSRTAFLPLFGRLSDRHGRKPFLAWGLFLYAVASVAFMWSSDVNSLIIIRFFQGIASAMILPVAQAYVGEITPPGKEGIVMGVFNISMYGSLSLGPLLGGAVNDRWGLTTAFAAMMVLSLFAWGLCLVFLPAPADEPRAGTARLPLTFRVLMASRPVAAVVVFRMAYTTCVGAIWAFLPVYATRRFSLSSSEVGVVIMMGVLVAGVLQTPMGWLADRHDKRILVAGGGLFMAAAVLLFPLANGFSGLFAANTAFGVGGGVAIPALMALTVVEGRRAESMGSVMALLTLGHSLGMLLGSLLAGLAADYISLSAVYPAGGLSMLAGTLFFLAWTRPGRSSG
ncbi:MAG: MFS transporter [Proteobacteria bacterium]|nr:MFS transporter [Pseudomonadota bacterium]